MEHIPGFTRSHLMSTSGECLCGIAPAAIMVDKFAEITLNTTPLSGRKSNYSTYRHVWEKG